MSKKFISLTKIVLSFLTVVCLTLSVYGFFKPTTKAMAETSPVSYTADFTNGLPYDWTSYNRSDVANTNAPTKSNGNLVLKHGTTTADSEMVSLYYGGVYKIAQSIGDVSDFTLTVTYRVTNSRDANRWFGIMYHTQETTDGKLSGYLMNYRVSGKSAASIIQNTPKFNDFNVVDSTGIAHDGNAFVTLKITVDGDTATHYVNNQLITSYNFSSKTDLLDVQKEGGFALIVNNSTVEIKGLTIEGARNTKTTSYVANFTNGLPSDWAKNQKGATSEMSAAKVNGGVKLTHTGSQDATTYFGGFYDIATGLTNATNFTLEAKVSMTSYENATRWFGIAYRKQQTSDGYSSFYLMNYRQNGTTAYSTVTSAPKFNDDHSSETTLTQGANIERTIRIVVKGHVAYYYVDTTLTQIIDLQSKESKLGYTQASGGFAILLNKCSITISSLWIKADTLDETAVDKTSVSNPTLEYAPTIVTNADEIGDIANETTKKYADSMIFEIDSSLNVVNNGQVITTLKNALDRTETSALPIVKITSSATANAFLNYIKENKITDITAISTNSDLLKTIRTNEYGKYVRAILDWTDYATPLNTKTAWQNVINTTNACRANVALIRESDATRESVTYIQSRLMTVWVEQESYDSFSTHEIVVTGAYGILTDNTKGVYDDFLTYSDTLPLVRTPFNIAHRGIPNDYPEGSLYGFRKAYETGATHLEVDVHLTSDGQLVVMHDNTIDRTTTGSGNVKDLTLAQIKNYKIDRLYNGTYVAESSYQPIPSLAEVFDYFKDKDIIYALEIKSNESNIVQKLKELIDTYNVKHQIFVITFKINVLEQMRDVLPEVPSALLGGHLANGNNTTAFTANDNMLNADRYVQIANLATNLDLTKADSYTTEALKHRGYMSFFWTYQAQTDIETAFKDGVLGITNNKSISIENYARYLQAIPQDYTVYSMSTLLNDGLAMQYITYGDDAMNCEATVHAYKNYDYYSDVIFKYTFKSSTGNLTYTIYSESVKVINPNYFMTAGEIATLLNTPATSLTLNDISRIEDAKIAYALLTENDQSGIDISKADTLIEEVTALYSTYEITVTFDSAKGQVTGAVSGDTFNFSERVTLTVTSNKGFKISAITLNGQPLTFSNHNVTTLPIVMIKNYSVVIDFEVDESYVEDGDDVIPDDNEDGDNTGDNTDGENGENTGNNTNNNTNNNMGGISCVMTANTDASAIITLLLLIVFTAFIATRKKLRKN